MTTRCEPRCLGRRRRGQCANQALPGSEFCAQCDDGSAARDEARNYRLTVAEYADRHDELAVSNSRSLKEEIALARQLLERRFNLIQSNTDLVAACGPLTQLMQTIERLIKTSHQVEQDLEVLLHESAVMRIADALVSVVREVLSHRVSEYESIVDEIVTRFTTPGIEDKDARRPA